MREKRPDKTSTLSVSRRTFMHVGVAATAIPAFAVTVGKIVFNNQSLLGGAGRSWPQFFIKRDADELFLRLTAVGFRVGIGSTLVPLVSSKDHLLVFTLPPQHFSETAITVTEIPKEITDAQLATIQLSPSEDSQLVFRVPPERLKLDVEELLAWDDFELVVPDTRAWGRPYDLEIPRHELETVSRIELPWGIELAPTPEGERLGFSGAAHPKTSGPWTEIWSTALRQADPSQRGTPLRMEVFSVRGFTRAGHSGSVDQGNFTITYRTTLAGPPPANEPPIAYSERAEIAVSLCRRFPYTGRIIPDTPYRVVYSAKIYLADENETRIAAYAPGRTIDVNQFRLTGRGGGLDLLAKWKPYPGSALSAWTHWATLGQDTNVEIVRRGFLFPFGTPCELVTRSERAFVRDGKSYFVAPLLKQTFIRVPQPNVVKVEHGETPFVLLSVVTVQSPPLDPPPSGNASDYRNYEYFLPSVKGQPFRFDHIATDHAGDKHRSSMPMVFVSNTARSVNGLIWEPGYVWNSDAGSAPDPNHAIPRDREGLRVVDKFWAAQPGRFADYGAAVVSIASRGTSGNTAQKLDWVEWVRGNIPDLAPADVVELPFRPRARTMRLQLQATQHLSGEPSALLATYRDLRFTDRPWLDPEPTTPADAYFANVRSLTDDPDVPYAYFLETRALVAEPGKPAPREAARIAEDIRALYFNVSSTAVPMPVELFRGIDNEIRFGASNSAEGVGGLTVPDTHASGINRRMGLVGDATFNERRWAGLGPIKSKLQDAHRLDFAAFSKARLTAVPLDLKSFDDSRTEADRAQAAATARTLMGYPPLLAAEQKPEAGPFAPGLKLGDLFGIDAQLIPGMRFSDLFKEVLLAGALDSRMNLSADGSTEVAEPLAWHVKLTGIEWLARLQESGELATVLTGILATLVAEAKDRPVVGEPLSLGVEANLAWTNTAFHPVDIGPASFLPNDNTKIVIDATARVDLGTPSIESNPPRLAFSPGTAKISARTAVTEFAVEIFSAIHVDFRSVSFSIAPDGTKAFATDIGMITLMGPLSFINQLQDMLGGLGEGSSIKKEITPQRARISQTLNFPADGGILLLGPAQITNLSFSWALTIPLMGRDVLCLALGVATREKPVTVFVPPWYGGKAYALIEATTRGCRLIEISMEYGALVPITDWEPARGQASLMAGIFYSLKRQDPNKAEVILAGFVKASANLTVGGIIRFDGLIYISLRYTSADNSVTGEAGVRVSIKIGFVRISYAFTATEKKSQASLARTPGRVGSTLLLEPAADIGSRGGGPAHIARFPFGKGFTKAERVAFNKLLAGYRNESLAA